MNNFIKLKNKIEYIKRMGWIECDHKNCGGVGLKIEKLLNINTGNFEIPDFNGIEIKTKKSNFRSDITLFNATPDNDLFEIKRLHELYAYPDLKNKNYKVLNKSVTCNKLTYIYNNIYFSLKIDYIVEKIYLIIYDKNLDIIEKKIYWSFSLLQEKLQRKLKYLCYIEMNSFFSHNKLYVKIKKDHYYVLKDFNSFINLLEKGKIRITFQIGTFKSGKRKGQIHDHGTSFKIDNKDLEYLFTEII